MANLQDIVNRSEVGAIKPWTKTTAPDGYLLCDGSAVSRTTYADLFAVISTTYGSGDGSSTFNVPQLQGKMPQGYDGNTYNLAGTGGANTVTVGVTNNQAVSSNTTNNQSVTVTGNISNTSLTEAQLATHYHQVGGAEGPYFLNSSAIRIASPTGYQQYPSTNQQYQNRLGYVNNNFISNTGSGTGHTHSHTLSGTLTGSVAVTSTLTGDVTAAGNNSFSPFVVVNYIIKH